MCASCGCGKPNDDHGDSRNITLQDLDQAAQAAGTTREQVVENMAQCEQAASSQSAPSAQPARGDYYQSSLEKQAGSQASEAESQAGQESGAAWQEGLPMSSDVERPQANP